MGEPSPFSHATPDAELFCPPSAEATRLLAWLPDLTSPQDGRGRPASRAARAFLVAPFTQLTLVSFDLQAFLFDVFHTTRAARAGHLVGMAGVVVALLAIVVQVSGTWLAGGALALVLLGWYALVARQAQLWLWWIVMVPIIGSLLVAAVWLAASALPLWLGLVVSGAIISLSHAFEPMFPPRAGDPQRWMPVRAYIAGAPGARPGRLGVVGRALRVAIYPFIGWFDEVWAAPRLLPYNVLKLMFAAGYAPEVKAELEQRAARAWASGNPALDYVGIGGGTFLAPRGPT